MEVDGPLIRQYRSLNIDDLGSNRTVIWIKKEIVTGISYQTVMGRILCSKDRPVCSMTVH